ncbi:hypothetical protein N836_09960 [Leptolyngbya sp. Heron Island J]|nr:hypothetical protein N836_09960 [Leptolyngbya sp. Heron Island J]
MINTSSRNGVMSTETNNQKMQEQIAVEYGTFKKERGAR